MKKIGNGSLKKKIQILVVLLVVACAVTIFTKIIFSYLDNFEKSLIEENSNYLSEIAGHIAINMQTVVYDTVKALETSVYAISYTDDAGRMDYLNQIKTKYNFVYVGYVDPSGHMTATLETESGNIEYTPPLQRSLLGESVVKYVPVKIFQDRAISGILFSIPIYDNKENPQKVTGVLVAMMDISNLNQIMSVEGFGGQGYTYIIDMSGEIVLRTKSMDYSNLYSVLKHVDFKQNYSLKQMILDISAEKEGFAIYSEFGFEKYIYYKYLGIDAWSIVTIVGKDAITAKTTKLTRELAAIGVIILFLFIVFSLFLLVMYGISKSNKQAASAKAAFLANMSHEIRTPMNAIVGISEILLRENLNEKEKDYVLSIVNAGNGLLAIINDILDISKIESNKFTIIDEEYELESLIYDITTIIVIKIGDRPVEFLVDLDPALPKYLNGDMIRVKQVLLNIIGNAVKFTKQGYIKFTINCQNVGEMLELTIIVEDTGMGIHKKDFEKLFVSFNQVDTHRNHSIEGTGLGLVISQRLCEMMGGGITVASDYGEGSTFTIKIMQHPVGQEKLMYTARAKNARLLLLEENDNLRNFFKDCLNRAGVQSDICENWDMFVEKLGLGGYTHIACGRNAIKQLKKDYKDKSNAAFITLLKLDEQTLFENNRLNVYIPLFTIQMLSVLSNRTEIKQLVKRSGIDILTIQPMPFVKILVVDDNETNLQVAKGLMNPYHMEIDCANSGAAAIRIIQEKRYDLIFMDHMMPEMDGVETVEIIRTLPGHGHGDIIIVALTANATNDARDLFLESGFDDFIAKPIETIKLNIVLKKWLKEINDTRAKENPETAKEAYEHIAKADEIREDKDIKSIESNEYVDYKEGLEKIGNPKTYCNILSTYCSSTKEKIEILTNILHKDIKRFTIEVHGIKGASAGIFAQYAAKMAEELETLGKSGNIDKINEVLPAFLIEMEKTIDDISSFIKMYGDKEDESGTAIDEDEFKKIRNIAIVDDNPVNLSLVEHVLNKHYNIIKLNSGEQLLEFLKSMKPDMILLDIQMPNMNGYEALKKINENPNTADIPVIFLTGEEGVESEREGFKLGAKDFIRKPFDKDIMITRVRTQMELHIYRSNINRQ